MQIEIPKNCEWLEDRQLSRLYFDVQSPFLAYMRGAIAWPVTGHAGMAIIGGQVVREEKAQIVIFEEYPFWTVSPVFDGHGQTYNGLSQFFERVWQRYKCKAWFYRDSDDLHRHYALQCYRSHIIQPPPSFIEVHYSDADVIDAMTAEALLRKRVIMSDQSLVRQHAVIRDPDIMRGYHALRVLIAGYETMPYRDPRPESDVIEHFIPWDED